MSFFRLAAVAATAAALLAPVAASAGPAELARDLAKIRKATERFRDINVAFAEGYVIPPPGECVDAAHEGLPPQLGGMGVHVVRPDLLGITSVSPRVDGVGIHTDFTTPSVLVYEPQADGSMTLVAVENLVFAAAWHAAGNAQPPSFHGNQYYTMVDNPATPADEAHGFMPHYELHIWLYRHNPSGLFAQFNPRTSCAGAPHEH